MHASKKKGREKIRASAGGVLFFFRENEENCQKQARLKASSLLNMGS